MGKVFVMGFVGCGNLGDEAILCGTLQALRSEGIKDPIVFSWDPNFTRELYGVKTLPVLPGLQGLKDFRSHLRRGDLFLLGGGSLLQDGQRRIVPFWLSRALLAKLRGCTVVYHAQGVGPIKTASAKALLRQVVPRTAALFSVRDANSLELIPRGVPTKLVADPALLLPPLPRTTRSKRVVVALRHTSYDDSLQALSDVLKKYATDKRLELCFLPMHSPDDLRLSQDMARLTGGSVYSGRHTVEDVRTFLAESEFVVAMRLHAAILAAGVGTPSIGLAYDPKVQAFYSELDLSQYVLPWSADFNPKKFADLLAQTYAAREEISKHTECGVNILRTRAQSSIPLALEKWRNRPDET